MVSWLVVLTGKAQTHTCDAPSKNGAWTYTDSVAPDQPSVTVQSDLKTILSALLYRGIHL